MADEFYKGPDWEGSSGPILSRMVAAADLWPHGLASEADGTGDKDILEDGLHPVLALGDRANRPNNLIGVVMKYTNAYLVTLNMADKFIVKNYVANIDSYPKGSPNYVTHYDVLQPVYIDDSETLSAGVTLSLSPMNIDGAANPLAGYIFYCQDEYRDGDIGGPHLSVSFPKDASDPDGLSEDVLCIMLVNDSGQAWAPWWFQNGE
jgi:hypothetical protein